MASGSSGRNNSASKGFDFATTDDIVCSYEDYNNQDNYNGRHSDSVIGSNSAKSGKGGSDHSQNVPNEEIGVGHGGSFGRGYGFWLLEMAHLSNLIAVSMKLLLVEIMYPLL
ncbi:hypothetical protein CsSME_00037625 [Camellia sinensis var. sinensis]